MNGSRTQQQPLTRRQVLDYALGAGAGCALSALMHTGGCTRRQPRRPNILFILIDTLRADFLGCYGNPDGHTPTLDSIARESILFDRAIAQAPWTQPSMASLFSSCHPGVHRVNDYNQAFDSIYRGREKIAVFSSYFTTLAEVFSQAGYITAAFVANPFIVPGFGFAQGFAHFDSTFADNRTAGDVVNKAALQWLKTRNQSAPFFCFLHYMDVHGPYDAGPEFLDPLLDKVEAMPDKHTLTEDELKNLEYLLSLPPVYTNKERHDRLRNCQQYWAARYAAGIRQADYHISNLKTALQQMNLWDGLYVILTADHGESLCEHGVWDHGHSVYHPELRVPLTLRWPGTLPAEKRIAQMVSLIDLMPTLTDQLQLPKIKNLQGTSFAPALGNGRSNTTSAAFAEGIKLGPEQKAVYAGDWKIITRQPPLPGELYNIADDPLERNNLIRQHPDTAKQLADLLRQQTKLNSKLAAKVPVPLVPLTDKQRDALRSIGYLR